MAYFMLGPKCYVRIPSRSTALHKSGILLLFKGWLLIILTYSSLAYSVSSSSPELQNYRAEYQLQWLGLNVGKSCHTLMSTDKSNMYILKTQSIPNLTFLPFEDFEESYFNFSNGTVRPHQYIFRTRNNKKREEGTLIFDWKRGKLIKQIKGRHSPQQELLTKDQHDKITQLLQLSQDLKQGRKNLIYTVAEPKKTKVYHYAISGIETLKTPLGHLKTLKIVHMSHDQLRKTELWLAQDLDYLMVKLIQTRKGKKTAEARIQQFHTFTPKKKL